MRRIVLILTLGTVGVFTLGAAVVSQKTKAWCGNAVYVGQGNVTITCAGMDPGQVNNLIELLNSSTQLTKEYYEKTLEALAKKGLSTSEIEEVTKLRYRGLFASTEADAERWGKRFDSIGDRQSDIDALAEDSKVLGEKYTLHWKPVFEFITKTFDDRVSEVEKRGLLTRPNEPNFSPVRRRAFELIAVDRPARDQTWIRDVRFPNRGLVQILTTQAQIHRGNFTKGLRVWFEAVVNGAKYSVINIYFTKEHLGFSVSRLPGFPVKELKNRGQGYKWDAEPLKSDAVTNDISLTIGYVLEFVLLNDRSPAKK